MGKLTIPYNTDNLPFLLIYKILFSLSPSEFSQLYYDLQKTRRFQKFTIKETNQLAELFIKKMDIQRMMNLRDLAIDQILDMSEPEFIDCLYNNTLPIYTPILYDCSIIMNIYSYYKPSGSLYMNRHMLRYMSPSDFIIQYTQ